MLHCVPGTLVKSFSSLRLQIGAIALQLRPKFHLATVFSALRKRRTGNSERTVFDSIGRKTQPIAVAEYCGMAVRRQ
jgi:hypothetical protein